MEMRKKIEFLAISCHHSALTGRCHFRDATGEPCPFPRPCATIMAWDWAYQFRAKRGPVVSETIIEVRAI